MIGKEAYAEKLAKIQDRYQKNVVDVVAAMSPEERKQHAERGAQVARETYAEWRELTQAIADNE